MVIYTQHERDDITTKNGTVRTKKMAKCHNRFPVSQPSLQPVLVLFKLKRQHEGINTVCDKYGTSLSVCKLFAQLGTQRNEGPIHMIARHGLAERFSLSQ